eukprot:jgi/Mesvir1/896/Mv17458-RA.1
MEIKRLAARAAHLRESLSRSDAVSKEMVSTLDSFDSRLSRMEHVMLPLQEKTKVLSYKHGNIQSVLAAAEQVLEKANLPKELADYIPAGPCGDVDTYLKKVRQLREVVAFFNGNRSIKCAANALAAAKALLSKGVVRCEEEFRQLLNKHSHTLDAKQLQEVTKAMGKGASSTSLFKGGDGDSRSGRGTKRSSAADNVLGHRKDETTPETTEEKARGKGPVIMELLPPPVVTHLHNLASEMELCGTTSFLQVYMESRSVAVWNNMRKMGITRLGRADVARVSLGVLEERIASWQMMMKAAVRVIFASEKALVWQVLDSEHADNAFASIISNSLAELLGFAEDVTKRKRTPEQVFPLMALYVTLHATLPLLEEMLIEGGDECQQLLLDARKTVARLQTSAQERFGEFEETVNSDTGKHAIVDGTVHPLTSYVVNYIKRMVEFGPAVAVLFQKADGSYHEIQPQPGEVLPMGQTIVRVLIVLQSTLEKKAALYNNPSLSEVFLMNNRDYIVRSVCSTPAAAAMLGVSWVTRHVALVESHVQAYMSHSWSKLMGVLGDDNITFGVGGELSKSHKSLVKDKLKKFNSLLEELHSVQSQWAISDPNLKNKVRGTVKETLLPLYRQFLTKYRNTQFSRTPQKYIVYEPKDVEAMLGDFFEGKMKGWAK